MNIRKDDGSGKVECGSRKFEAEGVAHGTETQDGYLPIQTAEFSILHLNFSGCEFSFNAWVTAFKI